LGYPEAAAERDPGFHERFAEEIEKRLPALGLPLAGVELRPAVSWLHLVGDMRAGRCDLAMGPPTILFAGEGDAWEAILQERREQDTWDDRPGGAGVRRESVLIVRDEKLASPEALAQLATDAEAPPIRAAFVAPESAAGFVAPRLFLAVLGFDDRRVDAYFVGSEEDVFMAVSNGMADLGALERTAFERLRERHEEITRDQPAAEGSTPLIAAKAQGPSPPLCASRQLRQELGPRHFQRLVEALSEAAREASRGEIEYVRTSNTAYREVIENARRWNSDTPFFALFGPEKRSAEPADDRRRR
jgi:ABC-type phosphate/phosphonate transport system substrate-binding protein